MSHRIQPSALGLAFPEFKMLSKSWETGKLKPREEKSLALTQKEENKVRIQETQVQLTALVQVDNEGWMDGWKQGGAAERNGRILGRFRRKSPYVLLMDWAWQICVPFAGRTSVLP